MPRRPYCYGIYMYKDNKTGQIVYIGKDSHIDVDERHHSHKRPSSYDAQPFNRALQNNPDRYSYKVYCHASSLDELNRIEFDLINLYRPKFNFRHGGGKGYINPEFEYTAVKNGMSTNGNQRYTIQSMNHKQMISSENYEFLKELALKLNSGELTEEDVWNISPKVVPTLKSNMKKSNATNSTGFYRVQKRTDKTCKRGFIWQYQYYDENKKHLHFGRTDLFKLKAEVERRGLPWRILDIDKAIKTIRSIHTGF